MAGRGDRGDVVSVHGRVRHIEPVSLTDKANGCLQWTECQHVLADDGHCESHGVCGSAWTLVAGVPKHPLTV
jgi:hypothetical protein